MTGLTNRSGLMLLLLITSTAGRALAAENPYPRDWYWGDDDKRAVHDAMIGQQAPKMKLTDWYNDEQTAETLKNKIVVVDFWATWCGPCIRSIPHNNEMAEKYADQGVVILGVCGSSSGQERMGDVAKEHKITYSVGKDSSLKAAEAWNVMWWPTYAVVDRNNVIRAVGLKPDYVGKVVEQVLEEQPYESQGEAADDSETAAIDPAWLEGSEEQRAELNKLQGTAPPALAVENWINSEALNMETLQGKVVLLDFWATWCGPCIAAIPHTNELQAKYADQGLAVIGVCHSRGGEKMAETAETHGIEFPIAVDVEGKTGDAFKVNSYPDYYLVDRSGKLRIADCKNDSVEDAIKALLAEPGPTQTASSD